MLLVLKLRLYKFNRFNIFNIVILFFLIVNNIILCVWGLMKVIYQYYKIMINIKMKIIGSISL